MRIAIAIAVILMTAACTTSDVATLRQLTIEDGARYVGENHERRRQVRRQLYAMEDEVIRQCQERARSLENAGSIEEATQTLDWCFKFLDTAYPDLATFKAIREGRQQFNDLRKPVQ